MHELAVEAMTRVPYCAVAQPRRALGDRVEDRLERRSGELLMTRRISAVAVCCSSASVRSALRWLQLVEQPRVLDRDDRLVGEGLEQRDLLSVNGRDLLR